MGLILCHLPSGSDAVPLQWNRPVNDRIAWAGSPDSARHSLLCTHTWFALWKEEISNPHMLHTGCWSDHVGKSIAWVSKLELSLSFWGQWTLLTVSLLRCWAQSSRASTPSFSPRLGELYAPLSQPLALAFSLGPTKLKVSPLCWQLESFWLWLPSGITLLFWLFWLEDAKQNSAECFRLQTAWWNQSAPDTQPWVTAIIRSQKPASNSTIYVWYSLSKHQDLFLGAHNTLGLY